MTISEKRPNIPLFVLRSSTGTVARIEARHRERGARVAVPGERLVGVNTRFAARYDEVHRLDRLNVALKERCDQEITALGASASDWAVVFAYDITGFDPVDWKPKRRTDDETIRAATQMRDDIQRAHDATPIEGADAAIADLSEHIEQAALALSELKNGFALEQEVRSETRELGIEFIAKAQAYRRALGRTIGQRHRDYRALDLSRRSSVEVPDIENGQPESSDIGIEDTGEFVSDTVATPSGDTAVTLPGDGQETSAADNNVTASNGALSGDNAGVTALADGATA